VCDLPFAFFSDPELMPILAAALVAVCYGCDQNRSVVQQEISTDMLRSLLKSCHMSGLTRSDAIGVDGAGTNNPSDSTGYDGSMKIFAVRFLWLRSTTDCLVLLHFYLLLNYIS
jgi:hypothetical protein